VPGKQISPSQQAAPLEQDTPAGEQHVPPPLHCHGEQQSLSSPQRDAPPSAPRFRPQVSRWQIPSSLQVMNSGFEIEQLGCVRGSSLRHRQSHELLHGSPKSDVPTDEH
jgi:hypothetical protein